MVVLPLSTPQPPITGRTRTASTVPAPGASSGKSSVPWNASDACTRSMATQGASTCVAISMDGPLVA